MSLIPIIANHGVKITVVDPLSKDPADYEGQLGYDDSTDKMYLSRYVFHNVGLDYIDLGRPSWISKLDCGKPYVIRFISKQNTAGYGAVIGLADSANPLEQQLNILYSPNTGKFITNIQGNQSGQFTANTTLGEFSCILIEINSYIDRADVYVNGIRKLLLDVSAVSYNATSNLYIGGSYSSGAGDNLEGDVACVEFYEGITGGGSISGLTLIERFTLDQSTGTSIVGQNGTIGTLTDGAPVDAWSLEWVQQGGKC